MNEENIILVTTYIDGNVSSTRAYPLGNDPVRLVIGHVLDEAGPGNASIHTKVTRHFESGADATYENIKVTVRRVPFFQAISEVDSHQDAIDKLAAKVPAYEPQRIE